MPRKPKPRWHKGNQLWVSDVGEQYTDKNGKLRRRTVSFPGIGRKEERRAKEALEEFLDTQAERERNNADPLVSTICELYLEWLEANREPSTFESNLQLLSKFSAYRSPRSPKPMGERAASTLHREDFEVLAAEMAARYKPSYCAAMHAAVMAAFTWAAKRVRGRTPPILIPANPFHGIPKPKIPRAPERYIERDELAAFLRWAWRRAPRGGSRGRVSLTARFDRHLCLLIRMVAHTGARPGELCIAGKKYRNRGFWWEHWNPDAGTNHLGQRVGLITLPKAMHKTGGKTGRPREIVVPPILVRALERHHARPWAHPQWVFTHRRGTGAEARGANTAAVGEPWTSHALGLKIRRWRRWAIEAGVKLQDHGDNRFHLYRLRHTRITDLVKKGMSYDQAAALTGTSGRMIETTYAHLTGSRLIDLDQSARRKKPGDAR